MTYAASARRRPPARRPSPAVTELAEPVADADAEVAAAALALEEVIRISETSKIDWTSVSAHPMAEETLVVPAARAAAVVPAAEEAAAVALVRAALVKARVVAALEEAASASLDPAAAAAEVLLLLLPLALLEQEVSVPAWIGTWSL